MDTWRLIVVNKRHTMLVARAGHLHLSQWFVKIISVGLNALIVNYYPSLAVVNRTFLEAESILDSA